MAEHDETDRELLESLGRDMAEIRQVQRFIITGFVIVTTFLLIIMNKLGIPLFGSW